MYMYCYKMIINGSTQSTWHENRKDFPVNLAFHSYFLGQWNCTTHKNVYPPENNDSVVMGSSVSLILVFSLERQLVFDGPIVIIAVN